MSDYNDGIIPEPCLRLDYGFGQEYASVELGDGTGYVRVTDELRSEYHKMERWYDDELKAALAENKKLRGLLVELYELTDIADVLGPNVIEWNSRMADIEHGMRELGIEVPQ